MKPIGIVTALAAEAACLIPAVPPDSPQSLDESFSIILCGSGPQRAAHGAGLLLDAGAGALVSFGVAGALADALRPGQLLLPETVISAGRKLTATAAWHRQVLDQMNAASMRAHTGPLVSSREIVAGVAAKKALRASTGADAVDMESAAILEVAQQRAVPALVLRAVLDTAVMAIPDIVIRHSDAFGRAQHLPLLADLIRHLSMLPAVIRLAAGLHAATGALRRVGHQREGLLAGVRTS